MKKIIHIIYDKSPVMKKAWILPAFAFLIACGGGESTDLNLTQLKDKRAELKAEISELDEQIEDLEKGDEEEVFPYVISTKAQKKTFEHFFRVQGNVEADRNVLLNAETGGIIKSVAVKEGDKVRKGANLIYFDTEIISRNIKEVESALDLANYAFEKQANLWKQKIGSELQFKQAKNQKESLELKLATLQSERSKSIVQAPFAGTVDEIIYHVGEMAAPGTPVVRMMDLSEAKITADVPENYLKSLEKGSAVKIYIAALDLHISDPGIRVTRIGQHIHPNNRTVKVQIDVPGNHKAGYHLRPNMIAEVSIRDYVAAESVVVPANSVNQDAGGTFVYAIKRSSGDHGIALKTPIHIGKSAKTSSHITEVEVTGGLNGTEEIILEGAAGIGHNDPVRIGLN